MDIDVTFDFRTDSKGKDPDSCSPTLKSYQQFLYSKPLPNGEVMELDSNLHWRNFCFSSDSITHGYTKWESYQHIISQVDKSIIKRYTDSSYRIGEETIFPCNRVPGVMTINQARGCSHKISDRIDLTLECIRRFYAGEHSPLERCFNGYHPFFELFVDFQGFIDFFHFQDLVDENYSGIEFLCYFDDFESNYPLPRNAEEYVDYIEKVIAFREKRNRRIEDWCRK